MGLLDRFARVLGADSVLAARNAVIMEYMLSTLTDDEFERIMSAVPPIVRSGAPHMRDFSIDEVAKFLNMFNRVQQLNMLALSSKRIGINPIQLGTVWSEVNNPFSSKFDNIWNTVRQAEASFSRQVGIQVYVQSAPLNFEPSMFA